MNKILYLCICFLWGFFQVNGLGAESLTQADQLWEKREIRSNALGAIKLYRQSLNAGASYEGYLKLARSLAFQGRFMFNAKQEEEKMKVFSECIDLAGKALQLKPQGIEGVFVKGMCHGERANVDRSLKDAGKTKAAMEDVIKRNPRLYDGMAYTIIGKLYHEIPGWPISFGDDDKSIAFLKRALEINTRNRYNYLFLTEVLWNEGYEKEAKEALRKGLALPLDPLYLVEDQDCLKQMEKLKKEIYE